MMVKQFSRGGGRGKNFSGRLRFFQEGFNCFWRGGIEIFSWGKFLRLLQGS